MPTVDDYIATLPHDERVLFEGMSASVKQIVPSVEQGVSYGMPAFLYRGKALVSFLVRKSYLSLYPFSGKVIALLESQLRGFEITSGSVHFSKENPVGGSLLEEILKARIREIEGK